MTEAELLGQISALLQMIYGLLEVSLYCGIFAFGFWAVAHG